MSGEIQREATAAQDALFGGADDGTLNAFGSCNDMDGNDTVAFHWCDCSHQFDIVMFSVLLRSTSLRLRASHPLHVIENSGLTTRSLPVGYR